MLLRDENRRAHAVPAPTVAMAILLALSAAMPVVGATASDPMGPPLDSANTGTTPMDQVDLGTPEPPEREPPEKELPAFFADSTFSGQVRSFYLYRDKYDDSLSEAWAAGGSFSYLSGWAGRFRLGTTAYTSLPLHAPEDRDGTLLLKPGQEGYAVIGQAFGEVKLAEGISTSFGRKEYNTPYLNKNDVRMTPNTFEAISFYGKRGGKDGRGEWRFGGGYVFGIKERNADEFVSMAEDAGADVDRGLAVAGFNWKKKGFSVGMFDYYSVDIINIFYTELMNEWAFAEGKNKFKLSAQFTDQQSTGDDLLTGSDFSTYQWGLKADITLGAGMITLAGTDTDDGDTMRNPWSGHPGYTSVQLQDFYRADESAVMLRGSYDFSKHGLKGFSTYALWVHGFGLDEPKYNEDEYDLNLQWTPDQETAMRGFSFRLRYAHVDQDGGGDPDIDDVRFIVNFDLPRKKRG